MIRVKKYLIILFFLTLLIGCVNTSNNFRNLYEGKTPEFIYSKGHKEIKQKKYHKAIDIFNFLNSQYPSGEYTELGNTDLIYAYYEDNQTDMALLSSLQFVKVYPNSKYLGYVHYMLGVLYYDNNRGIIERRLPYTMSQHDVTPLLESFKSFAHSIVLSPKASYVKDAQRRMLYIKNILAEYQYNIAYYYFERSAYLAAIRRAKNIIEKYPQTSSVEKAIVLIIQSYDILKLPDLAEKYMQILQLNYKNNTYLKGLEASVNSPTVIFK